MPSKHLPRHCKEVEPPLQDIAKGGLSQLLEDPLTDPGQEDRDLGLVLLLLEAGVVEDDQLGRLGESRQVVVEAARLLPESLSYCCCYYCRCCRRSHG